MVLGRNKLVLSEFCPNDCFDSRQSCQEILKSSGDEINIHRRFLTNIGSIKSLASILSTK